MPTLRPFGRHAHLTFARRELNWAPKTSLQDGLRKTIEYFEELLRAIPAGGAGL
jgi:nucleoside-diphosphate-sugar epimerase